MITITDAKIVFQEIQEHPVGTTFDVELLGLAGGAVGSVTLTRTTELDRWAYKGPLKIPQSTHAKELKINNISTPAGARALERLVRQELRGQARSIVLRNPRLDGGSVVFDADLIFETPLYVLCRLQQSQSLQLHAGPYRLDVEPEHVTALCDLDREARREALKTILMHNSEPPLYADEILRAGGSTETYNIDQLRLAVMAAPIVFDEDQERYVVP